MAKPGSRAHELSKLLHLNSCGRLSQMPTHDTARRRPTDNLVIWVVGGRGYGESCGTRREVRAGQMLVLRKGEAHRYWSDAHQPWEIYWAHFDGRAAPAFVELLRPEGDIAAEVGIDPLLRDRWMELTVLWSTRGEGGGVSAVRCDTALYGLLGMAGALVEQSEAGPAPGRADLMAVQALVHRRLGEPLNLATLADAAALSPAHLSRTFRQVFGVSPMQYVTRQRMAQACVLLEQTSQPVKAVAGAVGFSDPYHFSKVFRRAMGCSPSAYREQVSREVSGLPAVRRRGRR